MLPGCVNRAGVVRSWLSVLLLLAVSAPAFAEPRLVRVIWDVGGGNVWVRADERTAKGHKAFTVPKNADEAEKGTDGKGTDKFSKYETYTPFKKGDRVRLYVVNYNTVAHVWHETSALEQVIPDPSLVGAMLNSILLGAGGIKAFPAAALAAFPAGAGAAGGGGGGGPCGSVLTAFNTLAAKVTLLHSATLAVLAAAASPSDFRAEAKKLADVPVQPLFWAEFDNNRAWNLILKDAKVLGFDFEERYAPLGVKIKGAKEEIRAANEALLTFGAEFAKLDPVVAASCARIADQRDRVEKAMTDMTAPDSFYGVIAASYQTASTLWNTYKGKLATVNWAADAVEVVLKEPVVAEGVLRLDAVFVSADKTFTERAQRSLALKVETYFPRLTISTGVGANRFRFKKLQITQTVGTVDNVAVAKSRLDIVDDTVWEPIVPVWTQNILIGAGSDVGLYGTFGTTPDRNIFKNAIVGASVVVPRWRTVFTFGVIAAKGYEEHDLGDVRKNFTDSAGFLLKDADVTKLPVPRLPWKASPYLSVTFMLVSF